MLEGTEYRVVDTEDGQVASVTLTLDPDEEVRTINYKVAYNFTLQSLCAYFRFGNEGVTPTTRKASSTLQATRSLLSPWSASPRTASSATTGSPTPTLSNCSVSSMTGVLRVLLCCFTWST